VSRSGNIPGIERCRRDPAAGTRPMGRLSNADYYRKKAQEISGLASRSRFRRGRLELFEIAELFERMADRVAKASRGRRGLELATTDGDRFSEPACFVVMDRHLISRASGPCSEIGRSDVAGRSGRYAPPLGARLRRGAEISKLVRQRCVHPSSAPRYPSRDHGPLAGLSEKPLQPLSTGLALSHQRASAALARRRRPQGATAPANCRV